jgi:hypothetical protein
MSTAAVTPQQDWFAENAPKPAATQASGGDWFAQNAPATKDDRSFLQRFGDNIHSAATEPIEKPVLDSYSKATEFGAEHVRQGVAQAIEGTAHMLRHPIDAAKEMGLVPTEDDPTGVKRIVSMAQGLRDSIPKDWLDLAGKSGNLGGQILAGEAMGQTAGATARVVSSTTKAVAPVISDLAEAGAKRAAAAAEKVRNVTPKQAAQAAGAASGAFAGKGVLSIPGAYYGSKLGHVAEVLLGKDRANAPIFTKAKSLDEAADSLAEIIARDREAQTQAGALGNLPATGAKPAAITGEALATKPVSTNLTPEAKATSSAPRFTAQDRAAAQSLLTDALKQHTGDVVDQMIPGKNTAVKAKVDFYLQKGDVANAETALDHGAKAWKNLEIDRQAQAQAAQELGSTSDPRFLGRAQQIKQQMMAQAGTDAPHWTPLDRQPVPSTNEIRARVQREAAAPKPGSYADVKEDNQILDSMRANLQRHGWSAESEARREFIARNSTGMTKGELGRRFAAASGKGSPAAGSASATTGDLTDVLQKSLDAVRARSGEK